MTKSVEINTCAVLIIQLAVKSGLFPVRPPRHRDLMNRIHSHDMMYNVDMQHKVYNNVICLDSTVLAFDE